MRFLKEHSVTIRTLIYLTVFACVLEWIFRRPDWFVHPITILAIIVVGFLTLLALTFLFLQIIQNFRFERSFIPKKLRIASPRVLENFTVHDPLDCPGEFRKAQLHVHTSLSYDSDIPPEKVVASYIADGYQFVVITDHDRYSDLSHLGTEHCLVIPGIEATIPALFWPIPLGKHLVMINPPPDLSPYTPVQERIERVEQYGGVTIPAHLSWRGGAGSGRWFPKELLKLKNLRLVEIYSPYSRDPVDFIIWHKLNLNSGPSHPIWGVAVDDSHVGSNNRGWIVVKTPAVTLANLINALKNGAFYATEGPSLMTRVDGRDIYASAPDAQWLRFYDAKNQVIGVFRSNEGVYHCLGDEGFVRVEAVDADNYIAWSQPFWLIETL